MHEKLYDTSTLSATHQADKEFIKYMIELFVKNIPETNASLEKASKEHNWQNVYLSAHKMKASIDLFNLDALKELIRILEKKAKHVTETETIANDVSEVSSYVKDCIKQMKQDYKLN